MAGRLRRPGPAADFPWLLASHPAYWSRTHRQSNRKECRLKYFTRIPLLPSSQDAGLLLLRLLGVTPLLIKHGFEKIFTFQQMAAHFPDPIHIGPVPSLICAMLGDSVASILLLVGLFSRWAALVSLVNLLVAWAFFHHFLFLGHDADHGELIVLYIAIMATLTVTGAGRYSLDTMLFLEKETRPRQDPGGKQICK